MSNLKKKGTKHLICRSDETKAVVFDLVVTNQREKMLGWLKEKYSSLTMSDCEDIFQEASWELWKKFLSMKDWNGEPIIGMLNVICRNIASHFLRKTFHYDEWLDEHYPSEVSVEVDYEYVSPGTYRMMMKERMYDLIDRLAPEEREFIEMYLNRMTMKDIAKKLGFATAQTAKNKKCRIVARLRKELTDGQAHACPSLFLYYPTRLKSRRPPLIIFLKIPL